MGLESLIQGTTQDQRASQAGPGFNIPEDVLGQLGGPQGLIQLVRLLRQAMNEGGPPPPLPENVDFSKGMPSGLVDQLNLNPPYGNMRTPWR